jgi:hypothetical protein
MAMASEIRDEASLRAWLEERPRQDAVTIAARAALRVAPVFWEWLPDRDRNSGLTVLDVARPTLVAAVSAVRSSPRLVDAARDASRSASSAASTAAAFASAAVTTALAAVVAAGHAAEGRAEAGDGAAFAARATTARGGHVAAWDAVSLDAGEIAGGRDPFLAPLWPAQSRIGSTLVPRDWRARGGGWVFWADWYEGYLSGQPLEIDLLEQVALIPSADWDRGEAHVNGIIAKIYEAWRAEQGGIARALATLPPTAPAAIAAVQRAVVQNRAALPPTFDAIEALLALEIERLQGRNYTSDLDRDESVRLIGVFLTLLEAIQRLRAAVPAAGVPTDGEAARMVGLLSLYKQKCAEWPRANADDLVDGTWRLGIVGASAGLFVAFGLPTWAGLAIGGAAFGGKRILDALSAAEKARNLVK